MKRFLLSASILLTMSVPSVFAQENYQAPTDPVIEEYLKGGITFDIVEEHVKSDEQKWIRKAKRYLLYDDSPCRIK